MNQHSPGTIDISKFEQKYGKGMTLIQLADEIVKQQQREMREMKALLKKNK